MTKPRGWRPLGSTSVQTRTEGRRLARRPCKEATPGGREELARPRDRTPIARPGSDQDLLTVLSAPTMPVTVVLKVAIASSGEASPDTTLSVICWMADDTLS